MKKHSINNKINQIEPVYGNEEKKAIMDYLDSDGWLMEYKKTEELEKMIADYTGTKYCSIVCNGTVSLTTAILACFPLTPQKKSKHEILVPDYTMIASANSVVLAGQIPVLVDVEPKTFCMDLKEIKKKTNKNTIAVMLVSLNGRYPDNVNEIVEYCNDENLFLLEDAAQSLGSFYNRKHVGTLGDIGSFSFSMPKIITMGQGGCLVTDNKILYEYIETVKDFGRKKSGVDEHPFMGFNFKYTDLQAVFGIEQMKKLPERVKHKREMYALYHDLLSDNNKIQFIDTNLKETTPWMNDILIVNRNDFIEEMKKQNIGCRPFYPSIHTQNPYLYVKDKFPNSDFASNRGVWLPSSINLTDEDIKDVCNIIKDVVK